MVLSFIKYHIKSNLLICFVYGLLFFLQLVLIGEAICENGFNHSRIDDTTYTYALKKYDYKRIDEILNDEGIGYSDVCVVSRNREYDLVTYPKGTDERRLGYRKLGPPEEFGVIDLSEGISSEAQFRAQIEDGKLVHEITSDEAVECNVFEVRNKLYIGEKEFQKGRYISIKNTYSGEMPPSQLYCSYETFKDIGPDGDILISLAFKRPLNEKDLNGLHSRMNLLGNAEFKPSRSDVDSDRRNLVGDFSFVAVMIIIAAFSFSSLMISILSERNEEYRILYLCGATAGKIRIERLKHASIVVVISIAAGLALFWVIRAITDGFIEYMKDDVSFYFGNVLCYVMIATMTMYISSIFNRKRKRYAH